MPVDPSPSGDATLVGAGLRVGERRWAVGVHLGALALALMTSWAAGLAGMVGAAVVLWVRPLNSAFVAEHAKEAFNFNLSMFLYATLGFVFAVVTLGAGLAIVLPLWAVLALVWVVCTCVAAMRASDGRAYRYPVTMRLWR